MERKYYIPYYHNTDNINYENLFLLYLEADKTENDELRKQTLIDVTC